MVLCKIPLVKIRYGCLYVLILFKQRKKRHPAQIEVTELEQKMTTKAMISLAFSASEDRPVQSEKIKSVMSNPKMARIKATAVPIVNNFFKSDGGSVL